jgi:hypothetical protein
MLTIPPPCENLFVASNGSLACNLAHDVKVLSPYVLPVINCKLILRGERQFCLKTKGEYTLGKAVELIDSKEETKGIKLKEL